MRHSKGRTAGQEQRSKSAKERNERWAALSPQEQLDELNRRLGPGVGATKQRARLAQLGAKS